MPKRLGKHQPRGAWINPTTKAAILLRDGYTCLACGTSVRRLKPADVTIDHVFPRSLGRERVLKLMWHALSRGFNGPPASVNDPRNLYTCCRSCNSRRQAKLPHESWNVVVYTIIKQSTGIPLNRALARAVLEGTVQLTN